MSTFTQEGLERGVKGLGVDVVREGEGEERGREGRGEEVYLRVGRARASHVGQFGVELVSVGE